MTSSANSVCNSFFVSFSAKLYWSFYMTPIAKTTSKKIRALSFSMKFLFAEVVSYLYKSTIKPCMEYFCQVRAGAPSCYLEMLDKLHKRGCRTVGPSLAVSLELTTSSKCSQLRSFL